MHGSGIRVRIPHAHKWFAASVHKKRHGALGVILNNAEIIAIGFDWPGLYFPKSMACCEAHGILNPRVVPHLDPGVVPPIKTMPHVAPIIQRNPLFEHGRTRAKDQFHRPLHSVYSVNIADLDGSAAIGFIFERKIDG